MPISQKDIKLLWGRSGNRCAVCKIELSQKKTTNASYTLGTQAHIIGEKESAARGTSSLTENQRNSYHNLILLCPTHHTVIDENEEEWPIEQLHQTKSEHELWVTETLSETVDHIKLAKQIAVTGIIDSAVSLCNLENWHNWASSALEPDPQWLKERPVKVDEFRHRVIGAIWPKEFDELRRATITFSILIHNAAQLFLKHSEVHGNCLYAHKFYKGQGFNENYDEDVKLYEAWLEECSHLIYEATKAANWFADIVRKDINPMFFAETGKFLVTEGPSMNMSFRTSLLEYTLEEKEKLPRSL